MGRFVTSSGGTLEGFRSVASKFVKAQGGARSATQASRRGIRTAQRLAGALIAAVERGESGLSQFLSINFVGMSADAVLAALIDELAPAGAQNEDAAARDAACTVLEDLFTKYSVSTAGIAGLSALTLAEVADVVVNYVAAYIFARLMQLLAIRLERNDLSTATACRMERDVREYVRERVKAEVAPPQVTNISFTAQEGQRVVERVFNDAYTIIEAWEE